MVLGVEKILSQKIKQIDETSILSYYLNVYTSLMDSFSKAKTVEFQEKKLYSIQEQENLLLFKTKLTDMLHKTLEFIHMSQ